MLGMVSIFVSCVLFIHMGLGEAICETLHIDFIIFKCVKCMTFWTMLIFSLIFTKITWSACIAVSFLASYAALWADLALSKIAKIYDNEYEKILDSERDELDKKRG